MSPKRLYSVNTHCISLLDVLPVSFISGALGFFMSLSLGFFPCLKLAFGGACK